MWTENFENIVLLWVWDYLKKDLGLDYVLKMVLNLCGKIGYEK